MPSSASRATVAVASLSASSRVDDGWLRPAETTARVRSVILGSCLGGTGEAECGSVGAAVRCDGGRGIEVVPVSSRGCICHGGGAGGDDQGLVGGAVGHVGWAVLGELLAEHGNDLFAEQVQLLEHRLEGKAGVVHQPELALVVADIVPEA